MANITYTVKSGDSLSKIAERCINGNIDCNGAYPSSTWSIYGTGGKKDLVNHLADLNDIDDPNYIYVGQKLIITGTGVTKKINTSSKVIIKHFGYQSNSNNTLFAVWKWDKANTKEYTVLWEYNVGDGFWWEGEKATVTHPTKQDTYNIPSTAKRIRFRVKPIAKTRKVNGKDTAYFTAKDWSTAKYYDVSDNPPGKPGKPDITIDADCKLTASVSVSGLNASIIHFQVYQDDNLKKVADSGKVDVRNSASQIAEHVWDVKPGHKYCVKARSYRDYQYSDWSDPSANVLTVPPTPSNFTKIEFDYEFVPAVYPGDTEWNKNYKSYYVRTETDKGYVYEAVSGILPVGGTSFIAPQWEDGKYFSVNEATVLKLSWPAVNTATSYVIQCSTNEKDFDSQEKSEEYKEVKDITDTNAEIGITSSQNTYYVRYKAVNSAGESKWSETGNTVGGTGPAAPTTWSSSNTVMIGESLRLYWIHNSESGSKQTQAKLRMWINGDLTIVDELIVPTNVDGVNSHEIITTDERYTDGAKIEWCMKTAGESGVYGEWSVTRVVYIYKQPIVNLFVTNANDETIETLESFPLYISAQWIDENEDEDRSVQKPIGYHISIVANEGYDTVDNVGNYKRVNAGDQVYSRYFDDLTDQNYFDGLKNLTGLILDGGDLTLSNNYSYTVKCYVTMDSGLSAEAEAEPITVAWSDELYEPTAEMFIDEDSYALSMRPYCEDENGTLIEDIVLSVYRREFDGKFTELITGLNNTDGKFITDPHPALDYGRYRVVAKRKTTGETYSSDLPDFPINCDAAIIQWDEAWRDLGVGSEAITSEPTWAGSMIKLPYNIDISESTKPDVSHVKYIGRENPVSYYGTQLGTTSNWSMVIPADDVETLYQLRRLSVYTGDVYVRAPSGLGYWASINVSISDKHTELTIPITISVTRVEGGV